MYTCICIYKHVYIYLYIHIYIYIENTCTCSFTFPSLLTWDDDPKLTHTFQGIDSFSQLVQRCKHDPSKEAVMMWIFVVKLIIPLHTNDIGHTYFSHVSILLGVRINPS